MIEPYYQDGTVTLYQGDSAAVIADLPSESVGCIVTSPPYFGLRDYGVDGQIGSEESPAEYVAAIVTVMREARRVLAKDGTLWLNLGDSYSSAARKTYDAANGKTADRVGVARPTSGVPGKNLLGIPWRVAVALQDDGWHLRNDIIWSKPNAMPESVTDRLSNRHEHIFLLTRSQRYWFDLDPVREEPVTKKPTGRQHLLTTDQWKNPGDVWEIPTVPFPGAHFAAFPPEIPRRCIAAGCKPGGVVLDPFSGSGTAGLVAGRLGHPYIGIDLNKDYLDLSLRTRLQQAALVMGVS